MRGEAMRKDLFVFSTVFGPASFYRFFGAGFTFLVGDVVQATSASFVGFEALFVKPFNFEKLVIPRFFNLYHFVSFLLDSTALARGLINCLGCAIIKVGFLDYCFFLGAIFILTVISPLELIFISLISILPPFSSLLIFFFPSCYNSIIRQPVYNVNRFSGLFYHNSVEFSTSRTGVIYG